MPQTFNELIKIKKNYPNRFYINRIGLGQKKAQKHIYFDKNTLKSFIIILHSLNG